MRDGELVIVVMLGVLIFMVWLGFQLLLDQMQQPPRVIYVHRGGKDANSINDRDAS